MQIVSGLNPLALWPSLLVMDMLIFFIPGSIIVAFLSWSSPEAFNLQQLPVMAAFMSLYGLASISQVRAPPSLRFHHSHWFGPLGRRPAANNPDLMAAFSRAEP